MTWGVTDTGFVKKVLDDILTEIESDEKALISPSLNVLPTAVLGQINGIFADKLRELWDVAEEIYRSGFPDSASFESLDQLMALTGSIRLGPEKSRVTLDRLLLDAGASVPAGSLVSVGVLGERFQTLVALANVTAFINLFSVDAESANYGAIPGYAQTIDSIVTPIAGWTARAAMKSPVLQPYAVGTLAIILWPDEDPTKTDTVIFTAGGPYTAQQCANMINAVAVNCIAYDADGYLLIASNTDGSGSSIRAQAFTGANAIFQFPIVPVIGMNSVDAELGRLTEIDADARLRREEELRITGAATVEAIRARILNLTYVSQCFVFDNPTLVTVDGVPAKAFEAVIRGGLVIDEQEIAETIWEVKPAGIQAYGSINKTVIDTQGFSHAIGFSRPTEIPIYLELTVDAVSSEFPADGVDQIKNALKALCDALQIGEDVIALQFKAEPLDISGVEDVSVFLIDDVDPPVGSGNIVIAARELATLALIDIDLTMNWI
jgi:uncharacterized phage protein gp47/JayE